MARGEPYGSFTGVFGGSISFDWAPEPIVVAEELTGMARALDNMAMPLEASRQIAQLDIGKRFDTKTDPDGNAWAPWSISYAATNPPGSLLELTGAMRAASTSPSAFDVDVHPGGGQVIFTGAGVPEYWHYHQHGATRMRFDAETQAFFTATGEDVLANELPARPFVGLSEEAEIAIVDIFDEWFAGATSFAVNPSTGVVQRRVGGRYGGKVVV
jgi:phage gpG-like protein